MRRVLVLLLLLSMMVFVGCNAAEEPQKTFTEQDVHDAVTELVNGVNEGNTEAIQKYLGVAAPIAAPIIDNLVQNLQGKIALSDIRDVSIEGTTAQATVTIEVIPLNLSRDVTLNFDAVDSLQLSDPLSLLSLLLQQQEN